MLIKIEKVINGLKNVVRMKVEMKNRKWAKEVKQQNQNASPKFISSQTFQKHMQSLCCMSKDEREDSPIVGVNRCKMFFIAKQ